EWAYQEGDEFPFRAPLHGAAGWHQGRCGCTACLLSVLAWRPNVNPSEGTPLERRRTWRRRRNVTDSTDVPQRPAARPHSDLKSLDKLVGTWAVSGEADGTVTYEWTDGGFFLLQHVDLGGNKGLEVIGHEHKYGEEPSADITSRYYGFFEGETLDYTYEIKDDTLTIWMGEIG